MRHALWMAAILVAGAAASAQATGIGPDGYGYTAAETVFSWQDIGPQSESPGTYELNTAGTVDNGVWGPQSLGFTFNFYGTAYTEVYWSSNGLITFGAGNSQYLNADLAAASPDVNVPTVAVLWDDWIARYTKTSSGTYFKQVQGADGYSQFIIEWYKMDPAAIQPLTGDVTFEAILYEKTGNILFQYQDVFIDKDNTFNNGGSATVGIRDTGGQADGRYLQWSFDQPAIRDGEAVLFAVPEPVTMAGVFLGIGSLATYLRKRRAA